MNKLLKKLAEKTNTPELLTLDLPLRCMIWTGAVRPKKARLRRKQQRDVNFRPYIGQWLEKPRPFIQYNKQRWYVQRLIFELVQKPELPYQMRNTCGNILCVNPMHYDIKTTFSGPPPITQGEDITFQEVDDVIERMLSMIPPPQCWADFADDPVLFDVPKELIQEVLKTKNKEWLLP